MSERHCATTSAATIRRAMLPHQVIRRGPEQVTGQVDRRSESGAMREPAGVQVGDRGDQAGGCGVQAGGQAGGQVGQAHGHGMQVGLGAGEVATLRACVRQSVQSWRRI